MKKLLSICVAFIAVSMSAISQEIPAFPGAEGHARYTTSGGRGGDVIHVTNLKDSGAGSLRSAISSAKNREKVTIVFDVSGYIDLTSDLKLNENHKNITIAGQTAPYPGITLRYYSFAIDGSSSTQKGPDNIIIRFIRFRRSQLKNVNDGADAAWGRWGSNIILDHCSFSWSIDETASFYDCENFTLQWSTVCESLNNPGHEKGAHGYGGIWGGKKASFHHILLAHHTNRSPRLNGARFGWKGSVQDNYASCIAAEIVDFRNCVNYNWGTGNGAYGGPGGNHNIVNNYYKAGPATKNKTRVFQCSTLKSTDGTGTKAADFPWGVWGKFYISGNYVTAAGANAAYYDWSGITIDACSDKIDNKGNAITTPKIDDLKLTVPTATGDVTTHTAEEAYEKVLKYAGASLYRDAADARYVEETRTGTTTYTGPISGYKGISDFVESLEEETTTVRGVVYQNDGTHPRFEEMESNSRPEGYDTDQDGIPDVWEVANGLNPNDAADGNSYSIDPRRWYTNLEVYINSIVEDIMKGGNEDAISAVDEYYPLFKQPGATPLLSTEAGGEVLRVEYYTLDGKKLTVPSKGISVRRFVFTNGTTTSDLVIKK